MPALKEVLAVNVSSVFYSMNPSFLLGGDLPICRIGYGAMRLCAQPGNFGRYPDWEAGKALLRTAVELGVDLIDTAYPYGPGHNEELIADALFPYPKGLVVTTKGGVEKTAPDKVFPDGKPESLRRFCELSLNRLRVERIDLYQLHRPDPEVPFLDSVGALVKLKNQGKIRPIGHSNVSLEQVQLAVTATQIVSVQNRYNFTERADDPVLDYCAANGIAYLPWGPLAAKPFAPEAPLVSGQGGLESIAQKFCATPGQVALAWLLHRSPNIVLIPGTTSIAHLKENIEAGTLRFSEEDLALLAKGDA
jgi:pyridoxine 4-dehydrogenase